jgi:hypothetical protein
MAGSHAPAADELIIPYMSLRSGRTSFRCPRIKVQRGGRGRCSFGSASEMEGPLSVAPMSKGDSTVGRCGGEELG